MISGKTDVEVTSGTTDDALNEGKSVSEGMLEVVASGTTTEALVVGTSRTDDVTGSSMIVDELDTSGETEETVVGSATTTIVLDASMLVIGGATVVLALDA